MIKQIFRLIKKKKSQRDYRLDSFFNDYDSFEKLDVHKRFPMSKSEVYPCLDDNTGTTLFDAHYVYHPAWAARIIRDINPVLHVDISSTLHFCSMISAFVKTEFYDFRPAKLNLDNLSCLEADLTNLAFKSNSIASLSCMHTIEHIGLGRYGDPLDPDGDIKAIRELQRVCAVNGDLLIVVPVGAKKILFNAHRIYNPFDIVNYLDGCTLKKFALVNDAGEFIDNADMENAAVQKYGCGCYWFQKK